MEILEEHTDDLFAYLRWRGDLSLKQDDFNEVDMGMCVELVYNNLNGIVPGPESEDEVTIKRVAELYESKMRTQFIDTPGKDERLLFGMAQSKRFSNLRLSKYVYELDYNEKKQFAAIHIKIDSNRTIIVFRGTDGTMIGWRESFNISHMEEIPSQKRALWYVNQTARRKGMTYILAGHSKGGNLAMYASVHCMPEIQEKIEAVYNFDGPGFRVPIETCEGYRAIGDKIITFVPRMSVAGMLLEHSKKYIVVDSDEKGLKQHFLLNWKIEANKWQYLPKRDDRSYYYEKAISNWEKSISREDMGAFIDEVFEAMEKVDIHSTSDLSEIKLKQLFQIIKAISFISPESKNLFIRLLVQLKEESFNQNS